MDAQLKSYADFEAKDKSPLLIGQFIENEAYAVRLALESGAHSFRTYDRLTVTIEGEELSGAQKNLSAKRFVGFDDCEVRTKAEAIAYYMQHMTAVSFYEGEHVMKRKFTEAARTKFNDLRNASDNTYFLPGRVNECEYFALNEDEKVFNKQGQQIYPKAAPAPAFSPTTEAPKL